MEERVFIEAPNRGIFYNYVPVGGFRTASFFEEVDVSNLLEDKGNVVFTDYIFEGIRPGCAIALPRYMKDELLFGSHQRWEKGSNPYFLHEKKTQDKYINIGDVIKKVNRWLPFREYKEELTGSLLLPQGQCTKARNVYFESKSPLFSTFAELKQDKNTGEALADKKAIENNILAFANGYGFLYGLPEVLVDRAGHKVVLLESILEWEFEIEYANIGIQVMTIVDIEEKTKQKQFKAKVKALPAGEKVAFIEPVFTSGEMGITLQVPYEEGQSEEMSIKMAIVDFFNKQLCKYPTVPSYCVMENGRFYSYFWPSSLAGAIWLQMAQTVFKDGNEPAAIRCYLCGKWEYPYIKKDGKLTLDTLFWSQRKKEPYKGLYYHRRCYNADYMRNHREQMANEANRDFKKRKRPKKLLRE